MTRVLRTATVLLGLGWLFVRAPALRASLLVFIDSLAHAAQWIGVTDPGLAWLLLGVVGGAIVGTFVGARRAGRPASRAQVRGTAVVVGAALLVGGSYPPSGVAHAADRPSHERALAEGVHVATERVTLHEQPDAESDVTATLSPRTRLLVMQTSPDGNWAYVESAEQSWRHGWVRRASLSEGIATVPRRRVATAPARDDAPVASVPAYATGGEVQLDPSVSNQLAGPPDTVAAEGRTPARRAPESSPADGSVPNAAVPEGDATAPDAAVGTEVRTRLAQARGSAGAGDYGAALRALAGADEAITLATEKYSDVGWVVSLRRDASLTRMSVRGECQGAAAVAARRGDAPPRCE